MIPLLPGEILFRKLARKLKVAPPEGFPSGNAGTLQAARLVCDALGIKPPPIDSDETFDGWNNWGEWLGIHSKVLKRETKGIARARKEEAKRALNSKFGKRARRWPRRRGVWRKIMAIRSPNAMSKGERDEFYDSAEWQAMRYKIIAKYGRKCMACGRTPEHGVVIHVDHIKPLWTHPELKLNETNLQILCHECNQGKGCLDDTDFRPDADAQPNS